MRTETQHFKLVTAILPKLTLWDGWRICEPLGNASTIKSISNYAKKNKINFDLRDGYFGKPKPTVTITTAFADQLQTDAAEVTDAANLCIEHTAKDGEVAFLIDMSWMSLTDDIVAIPYIYLIRDSPYGWLVWRRDTKPHWEYL
jgi:hypothetical protein